MDFTTVKTRNGDGYFGWPEAGPFDCIMITAAIDHRMGCFIAILAHSMSPGRHLTRAANLVTVRN